MDDEIGKLIKYARIQKGYTQEALANIVGVQKSAVAKWENGRVTEIKRSNLISLADALGIEDTLLVGGTNSQKREKSIDLFDGLSTETLELIDCIKNLPEDKIRMLLQVARSIR